MLKANIDIKRTIILNDEKISIVATALNLKLKGDVKQVELEIEILSEVYKIVDENELFGLAPENRGEVLGGEFNEETKFKLLLKLKDKFIPSFLGENKNEEFYKEALLKDLPNELSRTLRSIDSWNALNVTQSLEAPEKISHKGSVYFGYQTKWATSSNVKEETSEIGNALEAFLTERQVEFKKYKHQEIWQIDVHHPDLSWICNIHLLREQKMAMIVCHKPQIIPLNAIQKVHEYLGRANFGLITGNFALNIDSGELNYKTSAQIHSNETFEKTLDFLLRQSTFSYSKYMRGIDELMSDKLTANELITLNEQE